jgi:lipoic acid synthetase
MEKRKPDWLKVQYQDPKKIAKIKRLLNHLSLHTVCEEANCPNKMECFSKGTATFMVLGSICSRNCKFCNVTKGEPEKVDSNEALHLAEAVEQLELRHVVVTTVTRDDLPDGGAAHFAMIVQEIRKRSKATIELLISDLQGCEEDLRTIVEQKPDIINHNLETVPSLYEKVRPMANYQQSLTLLQRVKEIDPNVFTKSGIMVGLGETEDQVILLMKDLRQVDCDFLTIGQYLAPSKEHLDVVEYVHPEVFKRYEEMAYELGFKHVASSPFVRSSYNAENLRSVLDAEKQASPEA